MAEAGNAALRQQALDHLVTDDASAARQMRRVVLTGLLVIGLSFGGALAWSSLVPLASAVVASGAVKVDSSRKKIQHQDGGVVEVILVQDGARVRQGDVLVRMDATRAGAAHGVVQAGQDLTMATNARLQAERDGLQAVVFPAELLDRARQDPQVMQTLKAQESLFAARRSARAGELSILDQQISALRSEITGLESQRSAKDEQLLSLESDLKSLRELDASGMVEKTRLRAMERDSVRLRGERDELSARMAGARTAISEKELKKFQVRKAFQEEVAAELKGAQAERMELQERESTTRRTLDLTELRAPVAGTVTDLRVHTAGGVVGPGEVLMEIVPDADKLVIEARVQPSDIDRVSTGQATGIKLHAFNQRVMPELNGQVSYVSADAVTDQRSELSFFLVRVDVPAAELQRLGDARVMPGMQADLFIRTGERTFLAYLLEPLKDSFSKAWKER